MSSQSSYDILHQASRFAEAGRLQPVVDLRRFTLDTALEAHEAAEPFVPASSPSRIFLTDDTLRIETPRKGICLSDVSLVYTSK